VASRQGAGRRQWQALVKVGNAALASLWGSRTGAATQIFAPAISAYRTSVYISAIRGVAARRNSYGYSSSLRLAAARLWRQIVPRSLSAGHAEM